MIAAGVLAGVGELSLALVIAAGATGALAGDSTSYAFGRTARRRLNVRPVRAAGRFLKGRGGLLIVVARFVPGGRTAVTLAAGTVMTPSRFVPMAAIAGLVWAAYAGLSAISAVALSTKSRGRES